MQPDEFSKKIAEQLFELHPEWWGFARWVQDAEEQHTHLLGLKAPADSPPLRGGTWQAVPG